MMQANNMDAIEQAAVAGVSAIGLGLLTMLLQPQNALKHPTAQKARRTFPIF